VLPKPTLGAFPKPQRKKKIWSHDKRRRGKVPSVRVQQLHERGDTVQNEKLR
jgi:hypothetical protein